VGEHETMGQDERIVGRVERLEVELVVEQCCIVEHACVRIETGPGGLIEDPKGLVGMWVQQVGEWGGIRHPLPSRNAQ
jgi:hypothetical protein